MVVAKGDVVVMKGCVVVVRGHLSGNAFGMAPEPPCSATLLAPSTYTPAVNVHHTSGYTVEVQAEAEVAVVWNV